jgi:hypothetical protein
MQVLNIKRNFVGFILALICWGIYGCPSPLTNQCSDEIKKEVQSRNGKYIITLFERNCGATTDFSTIVNLRSKAGEFNGNKENNIFVMKGKYDVEIKWEDDTHLKISYPKDSEVFKQMGMWREIKISFFEK